jgi:hypothetical protein
MSGGIHRSRKLSVKLTEQELAAWHEAANGEPLAVWVRIHINGIVREALQRSFGEGVVEASNAVLAAPAPSPEERLYPPDPELHHEFQQDRLDDGENHEIEEPSVEANPPVSADALLDPNCPVADMHWRIVRGASCPECGGVAK